MKTITKSLCGAIGVACVALLAASAVAQPEPTPADTPPPPTPMVPADLNSPVEPLNPPAEDGAARSAQAQPPADGEVYEPLENGPVHEAFAEQYSVEAPEPFTATLEPPPPVDELPPDVRPEGAIWIPGYWMWLDEAEDYIWVSGVWRIAPPGRQWVPGLWTQVDGGWQWTSGFWAPDGADDLAYLPPPPATLEVGPSSPSPGADYFWVPGCWNYANDNYSWRPGYWNQGYDNWLWMPSRFFYTPRGYLRMGGYWDRPWARRGLWFAPVRFYRPIYRNPGFFFRPRAFINIGFLSINIFRSPNRGYFYGNYAGPRFANAGFTPWFGNGFGRNYDPFFAHESFRRGRSNPNWVNDLRRDYRQLADSTNDLNRDLNRLDNRLGRLDGPGRLDGNRIGDGRFTRDGGNILRDVNLLDPGRTRDFEALRDIKLAKISQNDVRAAVERSSDQVRQLREQRREIETRVRDGIGRDRPDGAGPGGPGTGRPGRGNDAPGNNSPDNNAPGGPERPGNQPDDNRPGDGRPGNRPDGPNRPNLPLPGNRDNPPGGGPDNPPGGNAPGTNPGTPGTPGQPDSDRPGSRLRDRIGNPDSDGPGNRPRPGTGDNPPGANAPGNNLPGNLPGNNPNLPGAENRPGGLRLKLPGAENRIGRPNDSNSEPAPGAGANRPIQQPTLPGRGPGSTDNPAVSRPRLPGSSDSTPGVPRTRESTPNPLPTPRIGGNDNRPSNDGVPRTLNRPTPEPRNVNPPTPPAGTPRLRTPNNDGAAPPRITIPRPDSAPRATPSPRPAPEPRTPTQTFKPVPTPMPRSAPAPRVSPPSIQRSAPAPRVSPPSIQRSAPAPRAAPAPRPAPTPRAAPAPKPAPAARGGDRGGRGRSRGND